METSFKCLHKAKHRDDVSKAGEIQIKDGSLKA